MMGREEDGSEQEGKRVRANVEVDDYTKAIRQQNLATAYTSKDRVQSGLMDAVMCDYHIHLI